MLAQAPPWISWGLLALLVVAGGCGVAGEGDEKDETSAPVLDRGSQVMASARPDTPVAFSDGCVTSECHSSRWTSGNIHGPIAAERCDVCHMEDTGDHHFALRDNLNAECLRCHDVDEAGPLRHGLLTSSSCLSCHDPHGSEAPFQLLGDSVAATCEGCHKQPELPFEHPPFADGLCMTCHEPHKSRNAHFLYEASDQDHCRKCHESLVASAETVRHSHLGIEGGCLACHTAHSSEERGLLIAPLGELCLGCHEDVAKMISGASVVHDAVLRGERCLACHEPHVSDRPSLLRDSQGLLCLECHGEPLEALDGHEIPDMTSEVMGREYTHGPVLAGQCSACHAVHGAYHAHLLEDAVPTTLRGDFDMNNYALCFQCHPRELVTEERTTVSTSFRDGDLNLHTLHITSGMRGKTCAACHAVHGSKGERDIADFVQFEGSDWVMPIGFTLTTSGGTCASGCHPPLGYSRDKPSGAGTKPGEER